MRLINADALKDDICKKCCSNDCKPDATDTVTGCYLLETINNAPTIEAEPVKHAQWIYPYPQRDICRCTNCKFSVQDKINNVFEMYNLCPRCGARMDGETNA